MPDTSETRPDRRPAIVICAYDPDETGWDAVEDLSGTPWSPVGARTVAVLPEAPERLAVILSDRLRDNDIRAMLLVGRTRKAETFRVQMRAENRSPDGMKLSETGPAVARATAPVADIVRALTDAGLRADATSEGEDDVGTYLLYSVLADLPDNVDVPAIGLLLAPTGTSDIVLRKGVKAAAAAIARNLAPLPRTRVS